MTPLPDRYADCYPWHLDRDESIASGYATDLAYTPSAIKFARQARRLLHAEAREIAMGLGRRVAIMARFTAECPAVLQAGVLPHPLPAPGSERSLRLPDQALALTAVLSRPLCPLALRLAALVSRPR